MFGRVPHSDNYAPCTAYICLNEEVNPGNQRAPNKNGGKLGSVRLTEGMHL